MQYSIRFIAFLALLGCAVQSQPQGGAKDEQPPVIQEMVPEMGALNFSGKKAVVVFDEYIEAPKLRGAMKSTPELEELAFEVQGKRLELNWSKSQELEPNTTYRIDLGDAVQDLNERNPYKHLQFVWSTGDYIDSLRLDGQIIGAPAALLEKLTVALIDVQTDSTLNARFKTSPNKDGGFSFTYLPVDTFHILAFEDVNFNGSWDTTEPFGFSRHQITRLDSVPVRIPFVAAPFEAPAWDSIAVDSVQLVLDTMATSEVAVVSYEFPPHQAPLVVWFEHSSGWISNEVMAVAQDTLTLPARTLLPGAYVMSGFVDANENGVWDGPSFEENRLAEVLLTPQKFEFKAHWEVSQPVALPEEEIKEKNEED